MVKCFISISIHGEIRWLWLIKTLGARVPSPLKNVVLFLEIPSPNFWGNHNCLVVDLKNISQLG
jgi:hypothetical protein